MKSISTHVNLWALPSEWRNCPNWKELHRLQYIVGYKGAEIRSKNVAYTHLPESLGLSETPRQCGAPTQKPLGIGLSELLGKYQGDELREKLFKDGSDCRHHHHSCVSTHRWWLTVCEALRVSHVSHPQPHSTPVEKLTRLRVGTLRCQDI